MIRRDRSQNHGGDVKQLFKHTKISLFKYRFPLFLPSCCKRSWYVSVIWLFITFVCCTIAKINDRRIWNRDRILLPPRHYLYTQDKSTKPWSRAGTSPTFGLYDSPPLDSWVPVDSQVQWRGLKAGLGLTSPAWTRESPDSQVPINGTTLRMCNRWYATSYCVQFTHHLFPPTSAVEGINSVPCALSRLNGLTTFGQEYWQRGHVAGGHVNAQAFSFLIIGYHFPTSDRILILCHIDHPWANSMIFHKIH